LIIWNNYLLSVWISVKPSSEEWNSSVKKMLVSLTCAFFERCQNITEMEQPTLLNSSGIKIFWGLCWSILNHNIVAEFMINKSLMIVTIHWQEFLLFLGMFSNTVKGATKWAQHTAKTIIKEIGILSPSYATSKLPC
jgi:hypothetical protein